MCENGHRARVAEWYTLPVLKTGVLRTCGFDSHPGHKAGPRTTDNGQQRRRERLELNTYEDETVAIDSNNVTIKRYFTRGGSKVIPLSSIRGFDVFDMGPLTGRWRIIGLGPGRPRNWFAGDRKRRAKGVAISLDIGRWIKPAFSPSDPAAVVQILEEARAAS